MAYSKTLNRKLRQYAQKAYEIELHRALSKLDLNFSEWRLGTLSSGELSERLHQYETGVSRKLFNRYNNGDSGNNVAYAVVTGILEKDDISDDVLNGIANLIAFYEMLKANNQLQYPD